MQRSLILLLIFILNACYWKTSKDLPRDEEAIENFHKHRGDLEKIKEMSLYNAKYKEDRRIKKLLKKANCSDVFKGMSRQVRILYFNGGTILAGSELYYIYMVPYDKNRGDTILMSESLWEMVNNSYFKGSKLRYLGDGWYLGLTKY